MSMKHIYILRKRDHWAFTLVELIVVITIVWILSTVWFVSYSGYLTGTRDSNRLSQLTKLSDSLQVYAASKSLPLPDNAINITASWASNIIWYQWYLWVDVLETIDYTNGGKDPKDDSYFTYYLTKDRKSLQLLAFMEDAKSIAFTQQTQAATNYEERYPKTYGKKLGILVSAESSTLNTPAQEISANTTAGYLDTFNASQKYSALLEDDTFTASGYTLWALLNTRLWNKAPTECPTGFIWVPWNPEFNTQGFCVAQYEMTYSDADIPNSSSPWDWNTVAYVPGKTIISQAGKYPIADINQLEAIAACQSMWNGYHLITNNEWMTIGRSIEANRENWSSGTIWLGNLYNGVSDQTTFWCNAEWGNTDPRTYATKTWPWDASCNPRRSHKLAQWGGTIWDFSGNVWEHVNKANTIDGTGFNSWQTAVAGSSAPTAWDNDGVYTATDMKKYAAATGLGTAGGMWNLYYAQGVLSNVLYRGGHARDLINTGVFAFHLDNTAIGDSHYIGFRCAK